MGFGWPVLFACLPLYSLMIGISGEEVQYRLQADRIIDFTPACVLGGMGQQVREINVVNLNCPASY